MQKMDVVKELHSFFEVDAPVTTFKNDMYLAVKAYIKYCSS